MPKFRKRPVVIEAVQYTGKNEKEIRAFCPFIKKDMDYNGVKFEGFHIKTLEGWMKVSENDWLIKGIKGEFYPCRDDIFRETYEGAE